MLVTRRSTGLAGLINTIQMYTRPAIVAAVLGTVSTVGWVVQGVGIGLYFRQVRLLCCLTMSYLIFLLDMGTP